MDEFFWYSCPIEGFQTDKFSCPRYRMSSKISDLMEYREFSSTRYLIWLISSSVDIEIF